MKGYSVYTHNSKDFVMCDTIEVEQGFVIMKAYTGVVVAMYQSHLITHIREVEA